MNNIVVFIYIYMYIYIWNPDGNLDGFRSPKVLHLATDPGVAASLLPHLSSKLLGGMGPLPSDNSSTLVTTVQR